MDGVTVLEHAVSCHTGSYVELSMRCHNAVHDEEQTCRITCDDGCTVSNAVAVHQQFQKMHV